MDTGRTVPLVAAFASATTLADGGSGSTSGKGFTITGLSIDTTDTTYWAGNHGKPTEGSPISDPSLVHLSSDFQTILAQLPVTNPVQGVVYDKSDGTLWYTDLTAQKILHVEVDGDPIGEIALGYIPNGLARNDATDELWIFGQDDTLEVRRCSDGALMNSSTLVLADHDQLFFDDERNQLLVSYGANGSAGKVNVYEVAGYSLTLHNTLNLSAHANAIEGVVLMNDSTLKVGNDAYYHLGGANLNQVLTYTLQ